MGLRHKEAKEPQDSEGILNNGHVARRMHSFDRRIKSAHKEVDPDLDADVPSYMRQTCASLVKRSSFKIKDLETLDPRCARPKTQKRSKSSFGRDSRRRGRRSFGSCTPRSEPSMSVDGSPAPSEVDPPRSSCESIIPTVESIEPEADAEDMSSMMEACFDDVIHDALIKGEASVNVEGMQTEVNAIDTILTEDKNEGAESFCLVYDSDDGKSIDMTVPLSDLAEETEESIDTPRASTPKSEQGDDIFGITNEAEWLEAGEGEGDGPLMCHQLTDILASFTDSEFGDVSSQSTLDRVPYVAGDVSDGLSNLNVPLHKIPQTEDVQSPQTPFCDIGMDDDMLFPNIHRKLKSVHSFQVNTPGFLMMLGGNVLAGVVGAAIASAGLQISPQSSSLEVDDEEGDPSRDWFFESTSLGRWTAKDVYQ